MKSNVIRLTCIAFICLLSTANHALADAIYKANNDLPMNDPLSWEGATLPGTGDVAVFDERVTADRLSFSLTGNLAVQGIIVTNTVADQPVSSATLTIGTNGTDAATLTIGAEGVSLSNSGLAVTLNLPLALSGSQTWDAARNALTFCGTVSGTADWTMSGTSGVYWNVASGYNGNLALPNAAAPSICRFSQAGQIAKSFSLSCPNTATRIELAFPGTVAWSSLFADRNANVTNPLITVTSGATLQFAENDSFAFPGARFVLDNGNGTQSGAQLSGHEFQVGYQNYNCLYTLNSGHLALTGALMLGNQISSLAATQIFRQNGGIVSARYVGVGYHALNHFGVTVYEMNGGTLNVGLPKTADTGVRLSWTQNEYTYESPGAFLMNSGTVFADSIAFGRYGSTTHAVTNTYSLFKMKGGEFYVGRNGIYADRTWNNGPAGAGYGVKLSGGTLAANDNWSSSADILLSEIHGGAVIKTENSNGVPKTVVLNGALYGAGGLTKRGNGSLVIAGNTSYRGPTKVEAGTLVIQPPTSDFYRWTADSLDLTNNAPVVSWPDVNKNTPATNSVARAPALIRKELNGHNVVRFTSAASTFLAVAAENSPIGGATAFTIALVFKTGTAGVSIGGTDQWYRHTGLIDGEQGGKQYDWGMAYNPNGQVAAGAGDLTSNSDTTVYSTSGYSVSDSQPHVAIFTWRGTNITINLDGRAVTAATLASSVVARNVYPILFGSLAGGAGKYFNGDIAEIRIYRNQAFDSDRQAVLGMELAATYGVPDAVFTPPASLEPVIADAPAYTPPAVGEPLPYAVEVWDAGTLTGDHNSDVNVWTATGGVKTATLSAATVILTGGSESAITGRTAPKLALDAINGRRSVRFSASNKNVLGIPASDNPLGGSTNFTVALVFRTATAGSAINAADANWHRYSGLVDAEEPTAQNDWGLSFSDKGRVAAGHGNADMTLHSKTYDLNDGEPHVMAASYNVSAGRITVMVDGLDAQTTFVPRTVPRNIRRLLLGSINGVDGKYFTGDVAELHLYPETPLSVAEMKSLSQSLMSKYDIHPIPTGNTLRPTGSSVLASSGFEVSSGATLTLPASDANPYTLSGGQSLSGGGTVRGTIAVGNGGTVAIDQMSALTLDDLRLSNGSTILWNHSGGSGQVLAANSLEASGSITVQIVGGKELPLRVPFASYASGHGLETATWTVLGGKLDTRVDVNSVNKTLDLVSPMGTMISVR